MSERDYRILSLDGGGAWALIQALTLGDCFGMETDGREILARFDLVAANSGGSLVAGALALGRTPAQVAALFADVDNRRRIFARKCRLWGWLSRRGVPLPRYRTPDKLTALRELLPESTRSMAEIGADVAQHAGTGGSATRLLIVAYNTREDRAQFFRSDPDARMSVVPLANAMHASSNAPIYYFDRPAWIGVTARGYEADAAGIPFLDGGLSGYNNPVLAAVTEAVARGYERRLEDISVLSIGTGNVQLLPREQVPDQRPVPDRRLVDRRRERWDGRLVRIASALQSTATAILGEPQQSANYVAHTLLGGAHPDSQRAVVHYSPVLRLSPLVAPVRDEDGVWHAPDFGTGVRADLALLDRLAGIDMDAVAQGEVAAIARLTATWLAGRAANQGIHHRPDLAVDIGYGRYPAARAALPSALHPLAEADPAAVACAERIASGAGG